MKKHVTFAMVQVLLAMSVTMASAAERKPVTPPERMPEKMSISRNQMPQPSSPSMSVKPSIQKPPMTPAIMASKGMLPESRMMRVSPAHPLMVKGQTALVERKYPEAIQTLSALLKEQPNHIQALNGVCIAHLNQGNVDEAMKMISRAMMLDPVNSRLLYTRAQVLDVQNKPSEAVEAYLTFAAMAPNDGAALSAQGRAEELYQKVRPGLNPLKIEYIEGLRLLSLRQPEQAIPKFEQCNRMEPAHQQSEMMLGCAYMEAGQPDKAIPCFQAVLKTPEHSPMAYYHLGSSYEMRGETKNAQDAFRKFMQVAPQSETVTRMNRRMEVGSYQ